jgi:hypothetical protein
MDVVRLHQPVVTSSASGSALTPPATTSTGRAQHCRGPAHFTFFGFAATLVVVGVVAAKVGEKVLDWLSSVWMVRVQIATSLLIVGMSVVLTIRGGIQSERHFPRSKDARLGADACTALAYRIGLVKEDLWGARGKPRRKSSVTSPV